MYSHPDARYPSLRAAPRLILWQLVTLCLFGLLYLIAPHQLGVVVYKAALVTLAVVLAYWLDRALFPYARPHSLPPPEGHDADTHWARSLAMIRRAIIVLAVVLGMTLGL